MAAPGRRGLFRAAVHHLQGRGRESDRLIPGWPYQPVAALESGPTSWTAILDAVRLPPAEDATAVTAAKLRAVLTRQDKAAPKFGDLLERNLTASAPNSKWVGT